MIISHFSPQLERKKPPQVKQEPAKPKTPFENPNSPLGLEKLNTHLESHSYVEGFAPSYMDLLVHSSVPKPVLNSFPHVKRWYNHIIAITNSIEV